MHIWANDTPLKKAGWSAPLAGHRVTAEKPLEEGLGPSQPGRATRAL